jgi:hypothetical protein
MYVYNVLLVDIYTSLLSVYEYVSAFLNFEYTQVN